MRNSKAFTLLVLLGCMLTHAFGQTISGEVRSRSTQQPVAGATILTPKTKHGTSSDLNGKFSIDLRGEKTIVVSSVGYTSETISITEATEYVIELDPAEGSLDQVVVVGYGTQRKANLTGAVATVDINKTLGSRPITDVARGLQGSVAGLTITTPSGDLGTNPTIRLRGISGSLNGPGAQPLILVDNVELPDLRMINPDDIESISVLKDAASTSIYGTRAAWGVILITTKSGKRGIERSRISYSNNFSWAKPTTTPKIAPIAEGAEMALKALQRTNPNTTVFGAVGLFVDQTAIDKMREWQTLYGNQNLGKEMVLGRDFEIRNSRLFFYRPWDPGEEYLRDWTPQQTHNLTLSGGNQKTAYTLGLGYLGQKGVLKVNPDKFERFNVNLGVTSRVTDWLDARTKIILSKATTTRPFYFSSDTYDPWYYLYRWPAFYPYGTYEGKPFRSALTEVQQAKMTDNENTFARVSIGGTFKLAKGLTLDADYTYGSNNEHIHQTGGKVTAWDFWAGGGQLNYLPYTSATYDRATYGSAWDKRNVVKAFATYSKELNDHNFKVIAGSDVELFEYWSQTSERRGLLNPDMGEPRLATGDQFASNTRGHWATQGYFGRINYAYKGKYLLELNGRYDGSSSFPLNDQWAFFPSVSAGYRISEEPFMEFAMPVLSSLKIRGSWGSIGNQAVGGNRFLRTMASSSSGWLIGGNNLLTVATPGLVSESLTWETVTTLDVGLDARFLNDRFGVTFDWYKRTTSDMITAGVTVPATLGIGAPVRNYGEMQTTGWELAVDWNYAFGNGLKVMVTGVLSDFKEEITRFANTTKLITSNFEGKILGDIWGYETDRLFNADDFERDANGDFVLQNGKYVPVKGVATQSQFEASWFFYGPGDTKYRDLNGDGKVDFGSNTVDNHGDLVVIGNSTPRYQYGINVGAEWKGIDFNVFIQGVGKRSVWADGPVFIPGYRPGEAWYAHQLDYWTPDNPDAFYPRPTDQLSGSTAHASYFANFKPQTRYLLNMAYTRVKNLNVGYTLPAHISGKIKLQRARIYFSGENLVTFDNLDIPIDPEVDYTTAGLNDRNTFGRVYPYRKTLSFGIQLTL